MLMIMFSHLARNEGAPVPALTDILRVSELQHQFVACFCVLLERETGFTDGGREPEIG